ncbi:MAG: response regulator receiver [Anaerolineaceae bacterium]|nr:MAG: response regulator receiver [Anaerolineaceae bacterium]
MSEEATNRKILVVDDAPENTRLLSRILTGSGYEVHTAERGEDALRLAQEIKPDLVLLDINMPEMDGYEVCVQLKSGEQTRDIPVIFISALDDTEDKVKAFRAGGVDYIPKPFQMEEVLARVETHLALQRLQRNLQSANRELEARLIDLSQSQEQLRDRESKLRAFVAALPNLSFIYDQDGRYLEVMANETSLLCARPEDLLGRRIRDVLPADVGKTLEDAIHRAIETGKVQVIEYKIPTMTGEQHWFEGRVAVMEKNDDGNSKVIFTATQISQRVALFEEVQRLAMQDPLTDCFNRRHFFELAEQEFQRAVRYRHSLSLIMLDVDHFKKFNDTYGHQTGDKVLCDLVDTCRGSLRSIDLLGRYGGEEFALLLPETHLEGALKTAGRLRQELMKIRVSGQEAAPSVTVSLGVACYEPKSNEVATLDELVRLADESLYDAKSAGRNCVKSRQKATS